MMTDCNLWKICDNVGKRCKSCEKYDSFNAMYYNNVVIVELLVKILAELEGKE